MDCSLISFFSPGPYRAFALQYILGQWRGYAFIHLFCKLQNAFPNCSNEPTNPTFQGQSYNETGKPGIVFLKDSSFYLLLIKFNFFFQTKTSSFSLICRAVTKIYLFLKNYWINRCLRLPCRYTFVWQQQSLNPECQSQQTGPT